MLFLAKIKRGLAKTRDVFTGVVDLFRGRGRVDKAFIDQLEQRWAGVRVILERAIERGELPAMPDVELLSMLPLTLMQNWRVEHEQGPSEALVERIVAQFYSPGSPRQRDGNEHTAHE